MFDDIDIKSYKRNFHHIRRFTDVFFGTTIISQFIFFLPYFSSKDYAGNFYISSFNLHVCLLSTFFLYFTLVRLSCSYDKYYREEFFMLDEPIDKLKTRLLFWLKNKRFWTEQIIFTAIYIALPLEVLHYGIVYYLKPKGAIFQNKAFVLLIILGLMFILNLWARLTATRFWIEDKQLSESDIYEIRKNYKKSTYSREYAIAIFAYLVGSLGASEAISAVFYLISPVVSLAVYNFGTFVIIVFSIIVIPYILRMIRCVFMRFIFIRKLKKLCKRKKYRLSTIKSPFLSLFNKTKGESFNIQIGKRSYSCKLIASPRRYTPLYLRPNGTGVFVRTFHILKADAFRFTKNIEFDYESKHKQILIINPISKKIYSNYNSLISEMDVGEIIGKYEIYSATSFLNALERDVIDK